MKKLALLCGITVIFVYSGCQKSPTDEIPTVCAVPEAVTGDQISYSDLVDGRSSEAYSLRGIALGVDGKSSMAQDIYIDGQNRVTFSGLRCKASDGGTSAFALVDLDPNLRIPTSFSAGNGGYTGVLDVYFRGDGQAEGQLSQIISQNSLGQWLDKLRADGANVRIYSDADGAYLMIERTTSGEPYIFRMKIFYRRL